ncbi:MAG: hypothetical protein KDH96_02330 [Candidatus Riesia sp.]|nr:hypothetical protein [Candidatus Riesia sp.]
MACTVSDMGQGLDGLRPETPGYLVLDAGILYKSIDVDALRASGSDQVTNALLTATRLGATRGGGEFETGKVIEHVDVDGKIFPIKGMQRIRTYDPVLTVNLLEISFDNLNDMLGNTDVDSWDAFEEISLSVVVKNDDYIDNIAWLGKLATTDDPIIFVMENVLNTSSVSLALEDKNEATIEVSFMGHACPSAAQESPFRIFYPSSAVS